MEQLLNYIPEGANIFLQRWCKGFPIKLRITRTRSTKLGDYYKDLHGIHQISINHDLPPELFFFVLTHEIAHLLAFEKYGKNIAPHGKQWKSVYQSLLMESIEIYNPSLRGIILAYAQNPRAGFLSFTPLVRYFGMCDNAQDEVFVETLPKDTLFIYRGKVYKQLGRLKKNYLCIQQSSERKYTFKPLTPVVKMGE